MKKVTIIIMICNCLIIYGQMHIDWQKSYGGSNFEKAYAVQQTTDGGYIVAGEATSVDGDVIGNLADHKSAWLLKLDNNGDIVWTKCFHDAGSAYAIEQTTDGGFIVSCSSYTLLKITSAGEVEWTKQFGNYSFLDNAYCVNITSDGGFIVGGSLWGGLNDSGLNKWVIMRFNQNGDTLWANYFEDNIPGDCNSIKETSDGGYIAAGLKTLYIETENPGEYLTDEEYIIVKLNSDGDTLWTRTFGGSSRDIAYSVVETIDGNYVIAGDSYSEEFTKGDEDGWVIKLNANGEFIWEKFLGGTSTDHLFSINKTNDNGYVLGGYSLSYDGDLPEDYWPPDYWMIKINENGEVQWSECYGGDDQDYGQYALQTNDGGYIMVGRSWSNNGDVTENKGYEDIWIVKLSTNANNINKISTSDNNILIFPNPMNELLYINNLADEKKNISIFTIDSKLVMQASINKGINKINVSGLSIGAYIIKTSHSKGMFIEKIIKQ